MTRFIVGYGISGQPVNSRYTMGLDVELYDDESGDVYLLKILTAIMTKHNNHTANRPIYSTSELSLNFLTQII